MRSILLCEGLDDSMFITHYLHNTYGWVPAKCHIEFWGYDIDLTNILHRKYSYYRLSDDYLLVIEMKGKDSLPQVLTRVLTSLKYCPVDFKLDNLVIVKDNDDNLVSQDLNCIKNILESLPNSTLGDLKNMNSSKYKLYDMSIKVLPCILPYDVKGELETCLLNSLRNSDVDLNFIVDGAIKYVDYYRKYFESSKKYLSKNRLIPKANLSATMSIVNPDASIRYYSDMLVNYDWCNNTNIHRYYGVIGELITTKYKNNCINMNIL